MLDEELEICETAGNRYTMYMAQHVDGLAAQVSCSLESGGAALAGSPVAQDGLIFGHRGHSAASPGTVGHLRGHGQATKFHQQPAQSTAFFEVHIHKFEGHGLRAGAAYNRVRFDVPHAV